MKTLVKEPLLHFLVAGAALFGAYEVVAPETEQFDEKTIVVDRDSLMTFIQFRSKSFDTEKAGLMLDTATDEQMELMIRDFTQEEALYREAMAMEMEQDDYIIKRRLVQKMEYLSQGLAEITSQVTEEEVNQYFADNQQSYYIEPHITFSHVFLDADKRGVEGARSAAEQKLAKLNQEQVPFALAPSHSDRFPYFTNYIERTPEFVANHFGGEMAEYLFAMDVQKDVWQGPFDSPYGSHLVMVTLNEEGRLPELSEVQELVEADTRRNKAQQTKQRAIDEIVAGYDIQFGQITSDASQATEVSQ